MERTGDGRIFILLNIPPRAPREIHDARFPEAALAHDFRRRVHDGVARTGFQMVVDDAAGLKVGIDRDRAEILEAPCA